MQAMLILCMNNMKIHEMKCVNPTSLITWAFESMIFDLKLLSPACHCLDASATISIREAAR